MNGVYGIIASLHKRLVFGRRAEVLADALRPFIPANSSVLDIGCGNGRIGRLLAERMPGVTVRGIDIHERPECLIEYQTYDGETIPFPGSSFDLCMFVDVLHHTETIPDVLREAARVSRSHILIKDHLCETPLNRGVLKFMDWIGNRPHGVRLTYNYQSRRQWNECFADSNLEVVGWMEEIALYPMPFQLLFGKGLHFIALLRKK